VTGDASGTCKLSAISGKCLLAWCIRFVTAEKRNAKYVAALLLAPSNMASFWQISEA
jgi:hypothetical protein